MRVAGLGLGRFLVGRGQVGADGVGRRQSDASFLIASLLAPAQLAGASAAPAAALVAIAPALQSESRTPAASAAWSPCSRALPLSVAAAAFRSAAAPLVSSVPLENFFDTSAAFFDINSQLDLSSAASFTLPYASALSDSGSNLPA